MVIDNVGVLDNVFNCYLVVVSGWVGFIMVWVIWLFWMFVVILMVWMFGFMVLCKVDIGEFYVEFICFIIFIGFFWWLFMNGLNFVIDIMSLLCIIVGSVSGIGLMLMFFGIVDIGFDIFFKVFD